MSPVDEDSIIVDGELAENSLRTSFSAAFMFQCLGYVFNVAAIRRGLVALGKEAVAMPPPTLTFIITALLAFVEIKSQGNSEFPFQTHPQAIMVSVTSLLIYGLVSAAELVVSAAESMILCY